MAAIKPCLQEPHVVVPQSLLVRARACACVCLMPGRMTAHYTTGAPVDVRPSALSGARDHLQSGARGLA